MEGEENNKASITADYTPLKTEDDNIDNAGGKIYIRKCKKNSRFFGTDKKITEMQFL